MDRVEVGLLWLGGATEPRREHYSVFGKSAFPPPAPALLASLGPQRVLTRSSKSD